MHYTVHVDQRQEIVSVDRLKAHTDYGPVSPAEAAFGGRPPKKPAALSVQPCNFMKICVFYVEKSTSYLDLKCAYTFRE